MIYKPRRTASKLRILHNGQQIVKYDSAKEKSKVAKRVGSICRWEAAVVLANKKQRTGWEKRFLVL